MVLAELLELAPGGVEESRLPDGSVEYAVYGAPGELPALPALKAAAGEALVEVRSEEVADDWQDRWREFHKPLVMDSRLAVRPPWEPPQGTAVDVVIDPGRAFGTGAHATTRLCLELMVEISFAWRKKSPKMEPALGPLLDLGCGSGVLAIAAAKLGWGPVLAVDNDPSAVAAARENAGANRVEVEVRRLDLRTDPLPSAPTVVANLLGPLLMALASRLASPPPKRLIAGGLLREEADRVAGAFALRGLQERERRLDGDWGTLLLA